MSTDTMPRSATGPTRLPRLGFLGLGWIGRHRLTALVDAGAAEAVVVADADPAAVTAAAELAPGARAASSLEELLALPLDGVVIATPSAQHAEQAITALKHGMAVFCQKPLAPTARATREVLDAARRADRALAVDLSYRHTRAVQVLRTALGTRVIGRPYAAELVFHNAYGPDKPWFLDRHSSGGGCVVDLATHLIDLALWLTDSGAAEVTSATLLRRGEVVDPRGAAVEDFALAELRLAGDVIVRLACSWFLPAGCDCVIECTLYGTEGSLAMTNVDGSFYDFRLERRVGTAVERLVEPPDSWGGRALEAWARGLASGSGFDPAAAAELEALAMTIDAIYERAVGCTSS